MNLAEKIEVMNHFLKGGKVQSRHVASDKWENDANPEWHWGYYEYRKAPPPPEYRIVIAGDGRYICIEKDNNDGCGWRSFPWLADHTKIHSAGTHLEMLKSYLDSALDHIADLCSQSTNP